MLEWIKKQMASEDEEDWDEETASERGLSRTDRSLSAPISAVMRMRSKSQTIWPKRGS